MNAREFILQTDAERGQGWSDDAFLLTTMFEEYAALKVAEATQHGVRVNEDSYSCPVCGSEVRPLYPDCPVCGTPNR